MTRRLARWSATHAWLTIALWVTTTIAAILCVGALLGGSLESEGNPTNNPESDRAAEVVARAFPPDARDVTTDVVVVESARFSTQDPEFEVFVRQLAASLRGTGAVSRVETYLDNGGASLVSESAHATLIRLDIPDVDDAGDVVDVVRAADESPVFSVAVTGDRTVDHDFTTLSEEDLTNGELRYGLPAALIILLLVFGSVVGGLLPLVMAIVSIIVALGLVALAAQVFDLSVFVVNMLTGMGLALGIDYALFVLSRYREERRAGRAELAAIEVSGATANRAVVFSGTAFVLAMFGMLIVPSSIMRSLAIGAILVGVVSVLAATTLLPALLGLLGDRVDSLRIPVVGASAIDARDPEGRFWGGVVRRVLRRPTLSLVLSVAVLLALASPILGIHIGTSGVATLPDRFASKEGFAALERSFPGRTTAPVQIAVDGATDPGVSQAIAELRGGLDFDTRFTGTTVRHSTDGTVSLLSASIPGDPASDSAVAVVRELRSDVIPALFRDTSAEVLVGGTTAENIDYFDSVIDPVPAVIAFVLGLTFVLLTVVFRSVVVAATAVVLNLLSVAAAYGLLVLVFQHGVGADLLGFQQSDTIEAWVPLFLFSVLFGLSMDYQVFLLSRIRERFDVAGDTTGAITFGVASTARIITGAALIIVAVFSGFAAGDLIMFQQMGFGIAIALLIDATIIRSIVLPSVMHLLGRWNWYLPGWLGWLPRLRVEAGSGGRD